MDLPSTPPQPTAASQNVPSGSAATAKVSTASIVATMLQVSKQVSDLIFSPGRAPQIELNGQLSEVNIAGVGKLTPDATHRIAIDLIGNNELVDRQTGKRGLDRSFLQPARTCPLPREHLSPARHLRDCHARDPQDNPRFYNRSICRRNLGKLRNLRNGIVLVTGPTGSGKSSTLAAILNKINEEKAYHILTIEDPIEFLHIHKKSTIHQRELHSDTPSFALALRAALAPGARR